MAEKMKELNADIEELQSLLKGATRQKVKDILAIEIRRLETILITLKEAAEKQSIDQNNDKKPQGKSQSDTSTPIYKIRDYAWDQSDKFVKFYVTLPGVHELDPSRVTLTTGSTNFCLEAHFPDKIQVFGFDNLLSEISTEKSYHKVKTGEVVILLKKIKEGNKWTHVTATEKKLKEAREVEKMKDFSKDADTDDPSAGLMKLMKKMYQDGDDNMKRSIAEAWTKAQDKKGSLDMPSDL